MIERLFRVAFIPLGLTLSAEGYPKAQIESNISALVPKGPHRSDFEPEGRELESLRAHQFIEFRR
jgi:hypothetical protein